MLFIVLCVFQCLFVSYVVASGDQLDTNLVYVFCNPTGVLPLFLFCNLLFVILYLFVFLPVKSINEMK